MSLEKIFDTTTNANCVRLIDPRETAILNITRGYSPECVDAALKAVDAMRVSRGIGHARGCICVGCEDCREAIDTAIIALSEEATRGGDLFACYQAGGPVLRMPERYGVLGTCWHRD